MYHVLISENVMQKVHRYQESLRNGNAPGAYLGEQFREDENYGELSHDTFLERLINTKRPRIFAESAVYGDGRDWNMMELSILGDVSIAVPVTIFDNGRHNNPVVHNPPFQGTLMFVPGALLANGRGVKPADWDEVTRDGEINAEGYYQLYERRLFPALKFANDEMKDRGKRAIVTIPCVGCGYFSGKFHHRLGPRFENMLHRLLETHAQGLSHIRAVYFDPYRECENKRYEI